MNQAVFDPNNNCFYLCRKVQHFFTFL